MLVSVVRSGREVDDHGVAVAGVLVGMPDAGRDAKQSRKQARKAVNAGPRRTICPSVMATSLSAKRRSYRAPTRLVDLK